MSRYFSRREFLQVSSATAMAGSALFSALPTASAAPAATHGPFRGTLCFFSKAAPQLSWSDLAKAAKQAGFGGIDLTVRTEGHVLPERVTTDLPKAVAAIRAEGLEVPMISTELLSADHPTARPILETAGKLSIGYIKAGYYRFKLVNVLEEFREAGRQFPGLVELAGKNGVQVGYHNHPNYVGASIWDMVSVMEPLDPRWCGYYLDLGQISANIGEDEWKIATDLVLPRLKMVAIKDFTWIPGGPRKLRAVVCPLGKGMAPLREFLQTLAQSDFHGPISLHEEYEIPGVADNQGIAVSREAVPQVMAAAKQNLDYLKSLLHEAYEGA
jgi:L-ribulose-5-phosphate 3-epimerase